jgi:hypothetical protein
MPRTLKDTTENPRTNNTFESPPLAELLERAGFRVRGRRADCIHCDGHSRLTISFAAEVYYCHRCGRAGNVRTLARELGMQLAPESREARERRRRAAQFDVWRDACYTIIVQHVLYLTRRAELAKKILAQFPDCEPAWSVLADFYHSEAILFGALDTLAFEKLSPWLEVPMTREKLLAAFEDACERIGSSAYAA